MDNEELIQDIKDRIKQVEGQISNCKERIKNAGFTNDYKTEFNELISDKKRLEEDLEKLRGNETAVVKKSIIFVENLFHQLNEKIRKLSETAAIRADDKKVMDQYLKKHNQALGDYSINIAIKKLEGTGKELIAERTITIENKNTGQSRQYAAGLSTKQTWYVNFDEDLKSGKFDKG